MLERRSPFEQIAGARAAAGIESPGLRVAPVVDRGLLLLQGDPEQPAFAGAVREQAGLALPGPVQACVEGGTTLVWIAPGEFLLELPALRAAPMRAALVTRLGAMLAPVTDVSDAYAGFDVGGEAAADLLMTGTSLDLHPHAFGAGRAARTALAGVPAILWTGADPMRFRCLVDRSFALHLWSWFAQA